MWFNYRKPRPLKEGAFRFAAKYNVPVIPAFIGMKDTDTLDDEGYPVQELYVRYLPAIYPDEGLNLKENTKNMMDKNYALWVEAYEDFYKKKLTYGN